MLKKMMACVSALLVTASLSCAVLTASAEDKEYDTILKNPGLEDLNEDGTTTFWDSWPGNPAEGINQVSVSTDVKHSGNNSLKVELLEGNNHAIYQYHLAADKRFPFNKEYTFSCWVKMDNVVASDAQGISIGVNRKGADGNSYDLREHIELGTCDWTKVSVTIPKALVGLVQYDVIVDIGRGTGTLYVDDFELVEGSGTT
ncbi:MAG: carbohydrate binding domain-containing protein, partial [Acutalibacteraceae bacterium]